MTPAHVETLAGERVTILFVGSLLEDHLSIRSILSHSKWGLHHAFGCKDAIGVLQRHSVPVVICASDLPDGDWKLFREESGRLPCPPCLIVASRVVDAKLWGRLWGEVLNLGAYDLLATPFDPGEVLRVGSLAWHSWRNQRMCESKPPATAGGADSVPAVAGLGLGCTTAA